MCHVNRRPLVAHVDDADSQFGTMIPDRLDVAALQAEYPIHAASLEEAGDPGAYRVLVGSEVVDGLAHDAFSLKHIAAGRHARLSSTSVRSLRCSTLPVAVRGMSS